MVAFQATGWADNATLDVGAGQVPCQVYIDRGVQTMGSEGEVIGPNDTATFLAAEVSAKTGGTLRLDGGAETRKLVKKLDSDEADSIWILG
jgi:hypothetical protein